MHSSHPMGQPSFFYYNPEPNIDNRQHGLFSQHPSAAHCDLLTHKFPQPFHCTGMMVHSQQPMMYPQIPIPSPQMHQKPVLASPQPLHQKPAFLGISENQSLSVDTNCCTPDVCVYPSTPPLSVSGSATSSPPPTCGVVLTPGPQSYMDRGNIEGVKQGCEGDVKSEILAGGDWSRFCSPPLTPSTLTNVMNF